MTGDPRPRPTLVPPRPLRESGGQIADKDNPPTGAASVNDRARWLKGYVEDYGKVLDKGIK